MPARSDKLFQRKKSSQALRRRAPNRETRKRVLVVTEGEVTEVEYFEGLKSLFKLVNVELVVCGRECDSSPTSVVRYALEKTKAEGPHKHGGYNFVYCVFDRDEHSDFHKALSQIQTANKPSSSFQGERIEAIVSYPSFEYWLLLHFEFCRTPFVASGSKSAAGNLATELRKHPDFGSFTKSLDSKMLQALQSRLENAISNAEAALKDAESTGNPNPSTTVFRLVKSLRALRQS